MARNDPRPTWAYISDEFVFCRRCVILGFGYCAEHGGPAVDCCVRFGASRYAIIAGIKGELPGHRRVSCEYCAKDWAPDVIELGVPPDDDPMLEGVDREKAEVTPIRCIRWYRWKIAYDGGEGWLDDICWAYVCETGPVVLPAYLKGIARRSGPKA